MLLWAAERPERDALVLPDGVEVVSIPRPPGGHPDLDRVEALVPSYGSRAMLEALAEWVVGVILSTQRRLPEHLRAQQ